jgi:hypothetical protein
MKKKLVIRSLKDLMESTIELSISEKNQVLSLKKEGNSIETIAGILSYDFLIDKKIPPSISNRTTMTETYVLAITEFLRKIKKWQGK